MTTKPLNSTLTSLAYDIVHLAGKSKHIVFGDGSDYQGELYLSWDDGKFNAEITIYSEPRTLGGFYLNPPEIDWHEETDSFESVKIQEVANWLKQDWGFNLVKPAHTG